MIVSTPVGFGFRVEFRENISGYVARLVDQTTPARRRKLVKDLLVLSLRAHADYFKTQRSPAGVPWRSLAPTTLKRRYLRDKKTHNRAGVFSWQILQDRGSLRRSVSPEGGIDTGRANGAVRFVTEKGFAMGSNLPYASAHQFGRPGGWTRGLVRERWQKPYRRAGGTVRGHRVRMHYMRIWQGPIPARPFVGFSTELIRRMETMIVETIQPKEAANDG